MHSNNELSWIIVFFCLHWGSFCRVLPEFEKYNRYSLSTQTAREWLWFTEDLRPLVFKKKRLHNDYKATVLSIREFLTDANKCEGNVSSFQKKIINTI